MAITAFTSTAIIDATSIGKTVLTASSEGIAADAIGLGSTDSVAFGSVTAVSGTFSDTVIALNGSYSGSLNVESGGSQKLYNLGSQGDTDTEYLETSYNANKINIWSKATGSGVVRDIQFGSADVQIDAKNSSDQVVFRTGGTYRMQVNNTGVVMASGTTLTAPKVDVLGTLTSVDGDFSGDVVMAGDIKFSNLPTSDPGVPGQVYVTTGGALKVSQ